MLVRDYMTPFPKTLRPTDTLKDAAQLFYKYKISGAPVVNEEQEVCGLLTAAHLIIAIINGMPFTQPVSMVMTKNVITVNPDNTMEEAWQIPVGRLPVVSLDNKLVGMLTRKDFIQAFYNRMRLTNGEMQALIRSAHNGIVVINSYGVITAYNEAAAKLIGVPVTKALGRFVSDVIPDTGLKRILLTGQSETGAQLSVNGQMLLSNRSPIFEGPKVVGAVAIIQNISELQEVAAQLKDTQHRCAAMENIIESASQGIVVIDRAGVIQKVNKAYEDIFGATREELLGRPITEAIENTRLHVVLETGVAELGEVQNYKGRNIVVNRVPIFKDGVVIGAMGEAVFKDISEIKALLQRLNALEQQISHGKRKLHEANSARYTFADIVGHSRAMVQVKNLAAKAAQTDNNVLITGESGTGKELFAHAIHSASQRRSQPFICVNCAAIPADLLEAELFGYEDGAFTGARKGGKPGKFERANKGTIFLDEIGDMPLAMQAKLLRVIQDKTFERVGGTKAVSSDVRIIAATNKPLEQMVKQGRFREDLYYRLNVLRLKVPPLRERSEDIGELATVLLRRICQRQGLAEKTFTPETSALLRAYEWPGNVRELINILEQLVATVNGVVIMPRHLMALQAWSDNIAATRKWDTPAAEREHIAEVLRLAKGNKSLAAKMLGVHRSTLYEKLKQYDLLAGCRIRQ